MKLVKYFNSGDISHEKRSDAARSEGLYKTQIFLSRSVFNSKIMFKLLVTNRVTRGSVGNNLWIPRTKLTVRRKLDSTKGTS